MAETGPDLADHAMTSLAAHALQVLPCELYPYGDGFVARQPLTNACLRIDARQKQLLERMREPVALEELLRDALRSGATDAYTQLTALLVRLLRGGFFTAQTAATLQQQPAFAGITPPQPLPLALPLPALPALPLPRRASAWTLLIIASVPVVAAVAVWLFVVAGETDPARVGGAHLPALLFWLAALALLYSLRSLGKIALLRAAGAPLPAPALRARFGLPYLAVDDRAIICAGRELTVRYHALVTLLPAWLAIPALGAWLITPQPILALWGMAGAAATFFSLCPLVNSHLARLLRYESGDDGLMDGLRAFIARRFLRRLLTKQEGFAQEGRYLLLALLGVVWLYAAYRLVSGLIEQSGGDLLDTLILGELPGERIAAFMLLAGMVFPLILSVLALLRLLCLNLAGLAEKQLDRLWQLAGRWRRTTMPDAAAMVDALTAMPLFSGLSQPARQQAAAAMRAAVYAPGTRIIWQGEPGDAFYLIWRGSAAVVQEEQNGVRRQLAVLGDGDAFGEIALLRDILRMVSV
ncbi:MAG TPA: cyclic nucleotide-binding domain-containing protein, partial [bacterium]|nr:cyclic nucleotide-binding domain-containing protein [bacterium]